MIASNKQLKPYVAQPEQKKYRLPKYLLIALVAYSLVFLLGFLYMQKAPVFSSSMALVLPGSGSSSNFTIDEVGQANAQTKSPFSGGGFNPRVNYKEIIKSQDVIDRAAKEIGLNRINFTAPQVKLPEQTSIISLQVHGPDAGSSKQRAWALYEAFQLQLDDLRSDEAKRQGDAIRKALTDYERQLNISRARVVDFQQRSLLINQEQVLLATQALSELKQKQRYSQTELSHQEHFVDQLSHDLGVTPALAGQAFKLNSDVHFRGFLKELDASLTNLSQYQSHWGLGHPKVKAEKNRLAGIRKALFVRSESIVGAHTAQDLQTMDLASSPNRALLFADLVEAFANLQGGRAKLGELNIAIAKLADEMRVYARESAELARLERRAKLDEAVYTSAAARLDAGKADVFASYPVIQLLSPPSLPIQQQSPKLIIAVIAVIAGCLVITIGILLVWQRQYFIKQLLKRS